MMRRYDKYKDSGLKYLGEIPISWKVIKLKFLGDAITGITYSPDDIKENGILVLRSSNIQKGKLSLIDQVFIEKKKDRFAERRKKNHKKGNMEYGCLAYRI